MKKYIILALTLTFPVCASSGEAVFNSFAESTNMVVETSASSEPWQADVDNSISYALPDTDNPANPFTLATRNEHFFGQALASADDNYLLLAAADGAGEDLPFMDDDDEMLEVWDPLEPLNRGMFAVNDVLYFYLMKPIAKGYRFITPEALRVAVGNFFSNLKTPIRMINSGLQGKFGAAGTELGRFGLNTTIGILGFFDPADSYFELKETNEDTGQTFGHYGIGPGPYLVLPFIGPSSFRDGLGLLADSQMDIMTYLLEDRDYWYTLVFRGINTLALDKDTYEGIRKDSLDPYLFVRDAWAQYRQNLVEN